MYNSDNIGINISTRNHAARITCCRTKNIKRRHRCGVVKRNSAGAVSFLSHPCNMLATSSYNICYEEVTRKLLPWNLGDNSAGLVLRLKLHSFDFAVGPVHNKSNRWSSSLYVCSFHRAPFLCTNSSPAKTGTGYIRLGHKIL